MEPSVLEYTLAAAAGVPEGTFLCYGCRQTLSLDLFGKGAVALSVPLGVAYCQPCLDYEESEGAASARERFWKEMQHG